MGLAKHCLPIHCTEKNDAFRGSTSHSCHAGETQILEEDMFLYVGCIGYGLYNLE